MKNSYFMQMFKHLNELKKLKKLFQNITSIGIGIKTLSKWDIVVGNEEIFGKQYQDDKSHSP